MVISVREIFVCTLYKHVVDTNEDGDDKGDNDEDVVEKINEDDHANSTFINPFKKKIIVDIDVEVQKDENLLIEKDEDVND